MEAEFKEKKQIKRKLNSEDTDSCEESNIKKDDKKQKTDELSETEFIKACEKGNIKTIKLFIEKGYDLNVINGNKYPLNYACKSRNLEIVKLLL